MKRGRLLEYHGPDLRMSFGKITEGYQVYEVINPGLVSYTNDDMEKSFGNDLGLSQHSFHPSAKFIDPVSHTKLYKALK